MRQVNESYETARLVEELEYEGCRPFLDAVRNYSSCQDPKKALRLLEVVIWTSRGVEDDHRKVPHSAYAALCDLQERYLLFSPGEENSNPTTYRLARRMITELFF